MLRLAAVLVAVTVLASQATAANTEGSPLLPALVNISDWIMTLNVGSNNVSQGTTIPRSIFLNGNLARTLLATYRINGNQAYLAEGLRWCDTLVSLQVPIKTSSGLQGGFWDTGYNDIYIADTGTAVVALAICWRLSPNNSSRRAAFEDAMTRYTRFVTDGCQTPPDTSKYGPGCPGAGGWVFAKGGSTPDSWAGAVGDGWYRKELNYAPYTISTATTGSAFFPHWWRIAAADPGVSLAQLESMSVAAVAWILNSRTSDGGIPYIISPPDPANHTYQSISYCAESFVSVDLLFPTQAHQLLSSLRTTVEFLLANQNADGSWGVEGSGDGERSPRAATLLQWYIASYSPPDSDRIQSAIDRYVDFVVKSWTSYRVNVDVLVTGFVGLTFADLISPWSTFGF